MWEASVLIGTRSFSLKTIAAIFTEFAILILLMKSMLPKDLTNHNLFIFLTAGVVPCDSSKLDGSLVHHHSAEYFFLVL